MRKLDVVRAWKDEEYRSSLDGQRRAALPANPAGAMDLSDTDLDVVAGGAALSLNPGCGPVPTTTVFTPTTGDFVPCPSGTFQICSFGICPGPFPPTIPIPIVTVAG